MDWPLVDAILPEISQHIVFDICSHIQHDYAYSEQRGSQNQNCIDFLNLPRRRGQAKFPQDFSVIVHPSDEEDWGWKDNSDEIREID